MMPVKPFLVVACILASAQPALPATGVDFTFSADAGAARMDGTSYERVYVTVNRGALRGSDHKLSELVWDLEGVYGARASFAFSIWRRFELRASAFCALTEGTGGMVDYDWFLYDRPDYWTHRSRSTVDLDNGLDIDVRGLVHIVRNQFVTLDGTCGWRHMALEWSDRGVDYVYSSLGSGSAMPSVGYTHEQPDPGALRDISGTDNRVGILYEQDYLLPYVGMGCGLRWKRLQASAEIAYSPAVAATDRDRHVLRERIFEGSFSGGTYLSLKQSIAVSLPRRFFVSASCEWQRIYEFRGSMAAYDEDGNFLGEDEDGASVEHMSRQVTVAVGAAF
jgi:outer membrane protease